VDGKQKIDRIEEPIGRFFETITKKEFLEGVIQRGMLGYPVATVKEIFEDSQLEARDFWQNIEHPELGASLVYPGGFAKFSEASCKIRCRAPLIGEHNEEIYCGELGLKKKELEDLRSQGVV
jgi:formyl-CoA transferase